MKYFTNKKGWMPVLGLLSLSAISIQGAQATSDFSSGATVTYTINSIVNTTATSTDLTGLSVTGGYSTDTDPFFGSYIDLFGSDGVATSFAAIGDEFIDPVVTTYSKTMSVNGSVNDGVVDAFYLGLFDLSFDNTSANSFDIQVTLDYSLSAVASGQNATNEITLAYGNKADSFGDEDSVYAEPFTLTDSLSNSAVYTFTLAAGSSDALYVDVGIAGYAESIPAPVPVPGAFWLLFSALIVPVLKSFRQEEG